MTPEISRDLDKRKKCEKMRLFSSHSDTQSSASNNFYREQFKFRGLNTSFFALVPWMKLREKWFQFLPNSLKASKSFENSYQRPSDGVNE